MIPRVFVEGADISDAVLFESLAIHEDSQSRIPTAEFTLLMYGAPARWDEDRWDQAVWSIDAKELDRVLIADQATGKQRFGGRIRYFDFERVKPERVFVHCRCAGHASWLEHIVVPYEDFGATNSDGYILRFLIDKYAAGKLSSSGIVDILPAVPLGVVENQTLRQVFDWLADLSNGWWSVTPDAVVEYRRPDAAASPYRLTDDAPDGVTSFKFSLNSYSRDFARPVNHAVVIGGVLPSGASLKVEYSDPVSIESYGQWSTTLLDRGVTDANEAMLRAKALVEANAYALENGELVTYADVFDAGDYVAIETADYGIDSSFVLYSCDIKQLNRTMTQYTFGFGPRRPDAERLLRVMERFMRSEAGLGSMSGVSTPGTGSITEDMLSDAFRLDASALYGTIQGTDIVVNAQTVFGQITADKATVAAGAIVGAIGGELVTVDAGTIQGVITGNDVRVDTGTFQGLIISDQLANAIIDDLGKFADSTRPIPVYEGMPVLPAADLPPNAYFFNNANGHFYRVGPDGIAVTDQGTNPDALAGAMKLYSIGKISVQSFIGLIAANQIGSVNAGTIIGAITAGQNVTIDASVLQGTVTAGQNVAINTAVLQGTITSGGAVTVQAGAVTGTFQGSQIQNINANTITLGLLDTDNRISRISGAKLDVGTVNSDKLNSIAIAVGGGGGKPGRLEVFNSLNQVIGFIGTSGATEGGWMKTLGVGGTQAAPSFFADSTGKVTINNADFILTNATYGTARLTQSTFDPNYSSIGLSVTDPSNAYKCVSVSRGFVGYYLSNPLFSLNVDPFNTTSGELVLRNNGTISMILSGVNGKVSAASYELRGGPALFTGQVPAGRAINVTNGFITGYV